ncbi:capsule biosynthesis protein [Pseudooceanicola aestuarii]|uniref:capsule biosynthesis protein n=1 Tax=Pseudooceanicola aestuarii TaxID=2697319 RepID=UPI001EF9A67A|nr:capsule biosynthesis protein [Pseudooceanicola aestuarii]
MTTKTKARKFRIRRTALDRDAAQDGQGQDTPQDGQDAARAEAIAARRAAAAQSLRETVEGTRPAAAPPRTVPTDIAEPPIAEDVPPQEARPMPGPVRPARPAMRSAGATPRPAPLSEVAPQASPRPRPAAASGPATLGPASAGPAAAVSRAGEVASSTEVAAEDDINAIRKEGLTGRQLRMARRVAQKHGLAPTSDFDAVRLLRSRGIDPFARSNMLELVATNRAPSQDGTPPPNLPQTVPAQTPNTLPSTEMAPSERRQQEIMDIQRDITRRRRRRMALLFTRLAFFVFLPTILSGFYYYRVATPMYAANSEFLILQADATGGSPLGGLLSGTQFATNQDSIAVQSYLESKDAMLRLDQDVGFKSHFTQPWIDPIQRLEADPSNEQAYALYKKFVKIGYDPTEGVIRMEVSAAEPSIAASYSEHLIEYAEERVDELSRRKREDSMRSAIESLEQAKVERRAAQARLVDLQEGSVVDPEAIIAGLRSQINNIEVQLQEKELQLSALLDNARPNQAKVDGVRADMGRLQTLLDDLNSKMNRATEGQSSLAAQTAQIQMAQADLATADLFLQAALQNEKQTEAEANRQVRYLTTSVRPVAPEDPAYPRAFENTILVFLIMSGIYLMISLTSSILREQVSS